MENKNYNVKRDEIYVGDVCGIDPTEIEIESEKFRKFWLENYQDNIMRKDRGHWYVIDNQPFRFQRMNDYLNYHEGTWYEDHVRFHRSMLFVLDNDNHANDLLYTSPHYPILNISKNEDCLKSDICVCHKTYLIGKMLEHYGYPEVLTYNHVLELRKKFFDVDFIMDNCELFGFSETSPTDTGMENFDSKGNHRTFNQFKYDSVFPHNYFLMLRTHRDHFNPYGGDPIDVFKPCKEEGPIFSLTNKN